MRALWEAYVRSFPVKMSQWLFAAMHSLDFMYVRSP